MGFNQRFPKQTVIIAGPTGVGKTALALRLAEHLDGEIVGADAFQVYRGLPILTAQPTAEQQTLPHHLIGSVDPAEHYDAGRFVQEAMPILHAIIARGRTPILVGGTGFYLKALLCGLDDLPETDPTLRDELSQLALPELLERLRRADPDALEITDLANPRRVIRALEIILLTGKPLAASRTALTSNPQGVRAVLLLRDRKELWERIETNVRSMFTRGVEAEVAALPEEKIGPTASATLGLREIRSLLRGEITREGAISSISIATRQFAKRQATWFRNQHSFPALNLTELPDPDAVFESACLLLH